MITPKEETAIQERAVYFGGKWGEWRDGIYHF